MASAPSRTTTVKTVNNKTGITTSTSTVRSGNSVSVTKTTTIGAPKTVSPASSSVSSPSKASGTALAERWITGPNDSGWTMCGPVAVANHLLDATGVEASNADIERLYRAAGAIGDSGAPVEFFLAAACTTGLAGCRLASYRRTLAEDEPGVLLLAIGGLPDLHAAARTRDGEVVLWGAGVRLAEWDAFIIGAWSLTWQEG